MTSDPREKGASHPRRGGDESPPARERAIAQALAEFVDRQAREEPVDVEAFCSAHAEIAGELRLLLESLVAMEVEAEEEQEPFNLKNLEGGAGVLPAQLSGHKILGEIGRGGMGRVLLAYDEGLRRKVAIKTLSPKFSENEALKTRFMQEARALARLKHPNIVSIYSLGKPEEPPHFVMEYIEGTTLLEAARALTLEQKA
jgi:hypothetical protein